MRHKRFAIDELVLDQRTLPLRYCDLLVAVNDGASEAEWELLASTNDEVQLEQRTYAVALRSGGRSFDGTVMVVRSDGVAHVLRGVGPLGGVADAELDSGAARD